MATLNLGRIKPVFRGAYSGSTAYVVDDIVTYGDECFICIQAHGAGTQATSQTAYWKKLAAKGTDGTDVGTTITTQGDILYRDGSGLQRLAKGTAGQALKMNTAANAPEWGTISSDFVRIVTAAGDGTSVLDLDSCFSADYENYRILANIHTSAAANVNIRLQDSSNTEISSGYYYAGTQNYRSSSASGGDTKSAWNSDKWQPEESVETETEGYGQIIVQISRPFVASRYTLMQIDYHCYDGSTFRSVQSHCSLRNDAQMAGFRFYVTSGNITSSSSISVYGIKNS